MYIAFLCIFPSASTCNAVAKSGILAPANLNIEASSRMECRAEKDDKIDKTWKVDQPCSFGTVQPALELLKNSLAKPVNWFKRPRNSTLCSNVFVYNCTTVHTTCSPISTIRWSGAFQRVFSALSRSPISWDLVADLSAFPASHGCQNIFKSPRHRCRMNMNEW